MRANAVALLQVKTLELWIQKLPTVAPRMMASMVKERSAGPLHLMVSDWDWKDVYVPGTLKGPIESTGSRLVPAIISATSFNALCDGSHQPACFKGL